MPCRERRTHRVRGAACAVCQQADRLRSGDPFLGQSAGVGDQFAALLVGQLAEPSAALNAALVRADEAVDAAPQEADTLAPVEKQLAADEARLAPAGDCLGRDVELLGQIVDGQHLLADGVGRQVDRVAEVLDQQPQVVDQVGAGRLRALGADPAAAADAGHDAVDRVVPLRLELANRLLNVLHPAHTLVGARPADLLAAELVDRVDSVSALHQTTFGSKDSAGRRRLRVGRIDASRAAAAFCADFERRQRLLVVRGL